MVKSATVQKDSNLLMSSLKNMRGGQVTSAERKEEKDAAKAEVRNDVSEVVTRLSELRSDGEIYPIAILLAEAVCITIRLISTSLLSLLRKTIQAFSSLVALTLSNIKFLIIAVLRFYTGWLLVVVKFLWRV